MARNKSSQMIEPEIENAPIEEAPQAKTEKIMKSPEERAAIFAKNLSHESDRVHEWLEKLGKHLTSNVYGVSDAKYNEIVARFEKDVILFNDTLAKAKNKDSPMAAKPQLVAVSDVQIKAKV